MVENCNPVMVPRDPLDPPLDPMGPSEPLRIFKELQFFSYKIWFDKIGYHFLLKEEYFKIFTSKLMNRFKNSVTFFYFHFSLLFTKKMNLSSLLHAIDLKNSEFGREWQFI